MPCWLRLRVNRTRSWDRRSIASSMLVCCSGRVCRRMRAICSNMPWFRTRPMARCCASRDARFMLASLKPSRTSFPKSRKASRRCWRVTAPRPSRIEQAIDYWLKAGQQAMQHSAHIEAERHLRRGLELLIRLPETTARLRREIALQNTLGVCLMPARGFGSPEVAAAFNRAAEVCTRVNDDRGLFIALRGNGQYHMISGDMRTACDDARRILALAEEVGNHDFLIEAHHLGWSALCFAGEFRAAQRHAEEGISQYERERDHHLTYTYSGHDPGMCARAFGSLSLGQLGYPEKALASCSEGLALAEMLAHPFSIGIALWAAGILHQLRREPDAMRQIGERMIHYGGEKGLPNDRAIRQGLSR